MQDPLELLYRADWTQWSFSARVVKGRSRHAEEVTRERLVPVIQRISGGFWPPTPPSPADQHAAEGPDWQETTDVLLVAPGGRYRYEPQQPPDDDAMLILCDGESYTEVEGDEAERYLADPALTPFDDIVKPAWLAAVLRLTGDGTSEWCGRTVLKVTGAPRPPANQWEQGEALFDRVDLLIDAELGLVLRTESVLDGETASVTELRDLVVNPEAAGDAANFTLDPEEAAVAGLDVRDNDYYPTHQLGPHSSELDSGELTATWVARAAGRAAVQAAARGLARPEPPRAAVTDEEPVMPTTGIQAGEQQPISDATLHLLAGVGRPPLNLSAQAHFWIKVDVARRVTASGLFDPPSEDPLADEFFPIGPQPFKLRDAHRVAALRVVMPGRYRIDYTLDERQRLPLSIAGDDAALLKVYHNRVVASPRQPLPPEFARLLDPAWLLQRWRLSEAGEQQTDGRSAVCVVAEPPGPSGWKKSFSSRQQAPPTARLVLLIDTELGVVLRQVAYLDDEPAARSELRDLTLHEDADPEEFGRGIAGDLPIADSDGAPVNDLDLPPAARAVRDVGAELLAGAESAFGWLSAQARRLSDQAGRR
jgi:hypothetical protein